MNLPDISDIYSTLSITTAIFLGALHAFEPGHGKSIMAAYLVGTGGQILDALELGLVIAFTHTFSVILLGVLMKVVSETFLKGTAAPIIELLAAVMIMAVGIWILKSSWLPWKKQTRERVSSNVRAHEYKDTEKSTKATTIIMDRNIDYEKERGVHFHPELEDGEIKSKWQILILGISGGIVPCPAGIVILLTAIANGQLGKGLTLVLFFSLGVALTILTIAIIVSKLTEIAKHLFLRKTRFMKWIPFASGVVISFLGLATLLRVMTYLIVRASWHILHL